MELGLRQASGLSKPTPALEIPPGDQEVLSLLNTVRRYVPGSVPKALNELPDRFLELRVASGAPKVTDVRGATGLCPGVRRFWQHGRWPQDLLGGVVGKVQLVETSVR